MKNTKEFGLESTTKKQKSAKSNGTTHISMDACLRAIEKQDAARVKDLFENHSHRIMTVDEKGRCLFQYAVNTFVKQLDEKTTQTHNDPRAQIEILQYLAARTPDRLILPALNCLLGFPPMEAIPSWVDTILCAKPTILEAQVTDTGKLTTLVRRGAFQAIKLAVDRQFISVDDIEKLGFEEYEIAHLLRFLEKDKADVTENVPKQDPDNNNNNADQSFAKTKAAYYKENTPAPKSDDDNNNNEKAQDGPSNTNVQTIPS